MMAKIFNEECAFLPRSVGLSADGRRGYHWLAMSVWLEQDANTLRAYGRCLAHITPPSLGHNAKNPH